MTTQDMLWTVAAAALVLAAVAAFLEHRRQKRRNLDQVGWVPWNFIQVIAAMVAILAAILAMKA
jgi:uncharacterized membrane protein